MLQEIDGENSEAQKSRGLIRSKWKLQQNRASLRIIIMSSCRVRTIAIVGLRWTIATGRGYVRRAWMCLRRND